MFVCLYVCRLLFFLLTLQLTAAVFFCADLFYIFLLQQIVNQQLYVYCCCYILHMLNFLQFSATDFFANDINTCYFLFL